jgi:hypothetical protein
VLWWRSNGEAYPDMVGACCGVFGILIAFLEGGYVCSLKVCVALSRSSIVNRGRGWRGGFGKPMMDQL